MSESRRLEVLRAIVSQYIHTREPVGSKAIASAHDLGVSSATIRNDMAVLEDAGLIFQPHTSAGRIPTDKGYRLFVDTLTSIKPMNAPERRAVEIFLSQGVDIDDLLARTVRLLAQVTGQVAAIQYPLYSTDTIRRVEIVDLGPARLLVVVITSVGRVEERLMDAGATLTATDLTVLRNWVNDLAEGRTIDHVKDEVGADLATLPVELHAIARDLIEHVGDMMRPGAESKIIVAGMSNLARRGVDFRDISPVLDALEEQVALLRLFDELNQVDEVHVTIGSENSHDGLAEASVVAGTYGAAEGAISHLGVIGPTRMDYAKAMASVQAVAGYLSRYLAQ